MSLNMDETKKINRFAPIGDLMDQLLKDIGRSCGNGLLRVWDVWETAAGPVIAQNAKPAALKEKLLMVHVADSSWMHELAFLKAEIIHNINGELGEDLVEDIKFTIGPV
jgi:predicted nucleic acid-binding Zn ribbon protein